MNDVVSHRLNLPDGRRLGWHEWGAENGKAVIFCPGAGMAGAIPFGEDAARRMGLRILSVDRAGLGASDANTEKSFASWSGDIASLLQHLEDDAAFAIGFSQGAPFALALADVGLVKAVSVVSGQDELAAPEMFSRLPEPVASMVQIAKDDPERLEADIAAMASADWLWQMIETMSGPQDRAFYAAETFAPLYRRALDEGFSQGVAGYARDTRLAMAPWPFRLEDIVCPVRLWFGLADTSPVHAPDFGETLNKRLPNSKLMRLEGEGSAILWTHAEAILEDLAGMG
ncbi:alpha/beta fold hydrolase [Nitratireductor kimnyeongensis]|uniref:Alpha/beta fold hydrolase n=1 Tax=Nitratireductor kimnyeongensis TaxID=430679 RepID=A0ABW0T8F7_9HYPH|nr:alpha/beta fold hydrolase [Nitratireductor kimnyeongensis]QZZ36277.1 alpha/beta hydrolase [Nitratireductor kimnyeongensis]